MNTTLIKALVALLLACMLLSGSAIRVVRKKGRYSFLQLLGAGGLMAVVLGQICKSLQLFPWMNWELEHSVGHFFGVMFFSAGCLLDALTTRRA